MTELAMGQNPVPPANIPIPTKIGSKMGGAPLVLTHSQISTLLRLLLERIVFSCSVTTPWVSMVVLAIWLFAVRKPASWPPGWVNG